VTDTLVMTDQQLVDDYLRWLSTSRRRSPRTVRTYGNALKMYLDYLSAEGLALTDVRIPDVEAFGARPGRKKIKPGAEARATTVRKDVVIVRQFHRWANERDHPLRRIDTVAVPRVPPSTPKPVSDDVWRRLWGSDLAEDDRLWLGLGYFVGLRRAEIVTISPSGVDRETGTMVFTRKGGGVYPVEYRAALNVIDQELPQLTMGLARDWLDLLHRVVENRTLIGAERLWWDAEGHEENDGNRLNKRLDKKLLPQLGLPPHSVTPHRLRHSCATNLLRAGMLPAFVQRQLSHSSINMTMRYMEMSGEMARWWAREKGKQI
jgi:integrase/recombinase XerC